MATDTNTKPTRGRPRIGPQMPVRLDSDERATAELLGEGVAAEGIRIALRLASILGEAQVRAIIKQHGR